MSVPVRDMLDVSCKAALVLAVVVQAAVLSWLPADRWRVVRLLVAIAAVYGVIGIVIVDGPGWARRLRDRRRG